MTTTPVRATPPGDPVEAALDALPVKPRMRGWLHAGAAVVSVVTGIVLVAVAWSLRDGTAALATGVYSLTIVALFTISACYHRLHWSPRGAAVMKRLDHSMIFVFIAGTYTPIAVLALTGGTRTWVLATVWTGAALGVALKMWWPTAPRWVGVPLYIALGWVGVFVFPQILHGGGVAALVLIIAGGVAYTVGGIAYGTKRPDPFPATFGFHEVFHACTIVAALLHYLAIWFVLL